MLTTKRPRLRTTLVLGAILAWIATLMSCYTLVQHPRLERLAFQRPDRDGSCVQCHARDDLVRFVKPQHLPRTAAPWAALDDPWWLAPAPSADSTGAAP